MTNGSKFESREQMNRALKPGGVRMLNLSQTILQSLCCPDFYFKCFYNLLIRTLHKICRLGWPFHMMYLTGLHLLSISFARWQRTM